MSIQEHWDLGMRLISSPHIVYNIGHLITVRDVRDILYALMAHDKYIDMNLALQFINIMCINRIPIDKISMLNMIEFVYNIYPTRNYWLITGIVANYPHVHTMQ